MAKRRLIDSGTMVTLRAGAYWRDSSTGTTYTGPQGKPGSPRYSAGSGPFRVPESIWLRQEALPAAERIMSRVDGIGDD